MELTEFLTAAQPSLRAGSSSELRALDSKTRKDSVCAGDQAVGSPVLRSSVAK